MRLKSVRITNYKSILDSGPVEIEPKLTTVVGMTGAGKSSFLKMISGIDKNETFPENELTNNSEITIKFLSGEIESKDILQLEVEFEVEDDDKKSLPDEFKKITGVQIKRYFDGHFNIIPIGDYQKTSSKVQSNIENFAKILETTSTNFTNALTRNAKLKAHQESFNQVVNNLKTCNVTNLKEVDLAIQAFGNIVNTVPKDGPFQTELNQRVSELNTERQNLTQSLAEDPINKLYDQIPKPKTK